ncbi:hypothetical protein TWF970_006836 [Orbilia oligospora]|uniref:Carboxylic ester hydrolase n=1 Tax=Orbilia oligospora TaxID=2813651 RepID=A0A7C8R5U9_ORBOL|nr:hypothetical protein TWF970_006836 [Orbilia oligospora]
MKSSFLLSVLSIVSGLVEAGPTHSPKAYIRNGTVTGVYNRQWHQDFFLGIPYAEPPTGNRRFRPPEYIKTKKNFQATTRGKFCWGYRGDQWEYPQSEDCLTLNVIRPAGIHPSRKLPVAIFIHGGGFTIGSAHDPRYNMTFLVDQSVKEGTPIIGIGINYRLGALGWIASRQVAGTKNLNLGLKDQRVAMQWVQENIRAFGGDPRKVTLFGASAGALSIGLHQLAYNGRDDKLFSGVMMISGSPIFFRPSPFPETFQANYEYLITQTGCENRTDSLQCLRERPIGQLNLAINTTLGQFTTAVVDGEMVAGIPSQNLKHGRFVKVPSMVASSTDEGAGYARMVQRYDTDAQVRAYVEGYTQYKPQMIDRLMELYPNTISIPDTDNFTQPDAGTQQYGNQYHRLAAILGDIWFIAGKRYYARQLAAHNVPVWSVRTRVVPNGYPDWLGSVHSTSLPFMFYNLNTTSFDIGAGVVKVVPDPMGGPNAQGFKDLANFSSRSLVRFFARGDPAAGRKPNDVNWVKYGHGGGKNQIVWDIGPGGVYIEQDTFREHGIKHMMDHFLQSSF